MANTDTTTTDTSTEDQSGLKNKNAELKRERDDYKRKWESAEAEREQAIEDAKAETGSELDKANNELRKLRKQVTDLTGERDAFANDLKTIRVDNEVKSAIASGNVRSELVPAVEALLLRQAQYEDGVATINGKSIGEHTKAFFSSKDGSFYVNPPAASGSNSTGTTGAKPVRMTKETFNATEFQNIKRDNPSLAQELATEMDMPFLMGVS